MKPFLIAAALLAIPGTAMAAEPVKKPCCCEKMASDTMPTGEKPCCDKHCEGQHKDGGHAGHGMEAPAS